MRQSLSQDTGPEWETRTTGVGHSGWGGFLGPMEPIGETSGAQVTHNSAGGVCYPRPNHALAYLHRHLPLAATLRSPYFQAG